MRDKQGLLILIATPIGNMGDISPRAIENLQAADLIAAEDTRISGLLLQKLGIKTRMLSYHDHNAEEMRPFLLAELMAGKKLALISDAGTPLISDPGYKLVTAALAQGARISAVPGPSAPLMALILSGLPTDRFFFGGFLPSKSGERKKYLQELKDIPATLIFFETAPRLSESLGDCEAVLGNREAALARELTKLYEEVIRGKLADLARKYESQPPKGELVLVVAPPLPKEAPDEDAIEALLGFYLQDHSPSQAASLAAKELGLPRKELYDRAVRREKK